VLSLSACVADEEATLSLFRDGDMLHIQLQRPADHVFGAVTATANGVDTGEPTIDPGRPGSWEPRQEQIPAYANFYVPVPVERALHLEIDEGNEQFVADLPDFNAPRALRVRTPTNVLYPDEWIEVDSGVATDELVGGFDVRFQGAYCFSSWNTKDNVDSISYQMAPQSRFEDCGTPDSGGAHPVTLEMRLQPNTAITRCDGPNLTCNPVRAASFLSTIPTTLQP
jgi:hypothetical protein